MFFRILSKTTWLDSVSEKHSARVCLPKLHTVRVHAQHCSQVAGTGGLELMQDAFLMVVCRREKDS